MKTLLLVRHGHTIWHDTGGVAGRSDIDLSEQGQQAVSKLAKSLSNELALDSWHISPLLRTRRTSELLCTGSNLRHYPQPVEDKRLVELNFGDWEGMTWQAVHEQYQKDMELWGQDWVNRAPPNGESFAEQTARCTDWLNAWMHGSLKGTDGSHTAMVVLHGGSIRALLCQCLGWPLTQAMSFSVDPASVTRLDYNTENHSWLVRKINGYNF